MDQQQFDRIENKVDGLHEKIDNFTTNCASHTSETNIRISYLERITWGSIGGISFLVCGVAYVIIMMFAK